MDVVLNDLLYMISAYELNFEEVELFVTSKNYYLVINNEKDFNDFFYSKIIYENVIMFRITKHPTSKKCQIIFELRDSYELSRFPKARMFQKN